MKTIPLEQWVFTQVGGGKGTQIDEYLPAFGSTTVHVELLKAKRIPDPFLGLNEHDVQWVGESDWIFKQSFVVSENDLRYANIDLVFEGLDTFAAITLNGKEILKTSNQFVGYRAGAKQHLKSGENELVIYFTSAFEKGRDVEKQHGKLNLWNGDSSRLHVRKAQYNYGWDWGPILMTTGPWKPVYLEMYHNRISDLYIKNDVSRDLAVNMTVEMTFFEKSPGQASLILKASDGAIVASNSNIRMDNGHAQVTFSFKPGELQLWYPVGYGAQPLYTVEADITGEDGKLLDSKIQRIGFRRTIIVQEKLIDQPGLSFFFEINNIPIFAGGSNWIPGDSFHAHRMNPERYRAWLKLSVDGNQNMIRVWGGGIYEADVFYDICDELGILVWQDFMFGCGQYPAYDSFLASVVEEAEYNVKRLRSHPSLCIFAGNNEDYQVAESMNLELDYSDETSDFRKTNFPARYIYERTLPEIVGRLSNIFYHRSSPYSGQGKPSTDRTLGDLHQWNVWHGSQEPWTKWDILAGRFVSEFGMEGYPNMRTVDYWLGGETKERFPQSRTNNSHNKADGFERRLELYLVENFKHSFEMERYAYATQIMQAECLASAYRLWRRNWAGKGKEYTAGALVWYLNDCWPTTRQVCIWSIADYFLRPKPSYFAIARELRPYTVGITRKEITTFVDERSAAKFTIDTVFEVWATNSTLTAKDVTLEFSNHDIHDPEFNDGWSKTVTLAPNSSTEVFKGSVNALQQRTTKSQVPKTIIASARLRDEDGTVLARYSNWPEPYKFIDFPKDVGFKIEISSDGESVTLSSKRPVKGIVLDVEGEDVKWSDQAIDLIPGDNQLVHAIGLKGRSVHARYLEHDA
ncbi:glycoside hydrolase family 2 protein [Rhodocollybia butyracea]|uniref:Beta-mannosidase B n=1 Tax=Rhodocollybia butyracea TaxID=206335 RepID=A0A9P5Q6V0_9AGAR|nr:glycoside hydrolase family 2 protein [Rhodocollybia butyracea]